MQVVGAPTGNVVGPTVNLRLPSEGFWRIVSLVGEYSAPAAAAVPLVRFSVLSGQSNLFALGQMSCGVAAYDGMFGWQKDGQTLVPAVVTDHALAPAPTHVMDCGKGLTLVLEGSAGVDPSGFFNVILTLEQMAADDGGKL